MSAREIPHPDRAGRAPRVDGVDGAGRAREPRSLSVVVPARDEVDNLEAVVAAVDAALGESRDWELLLVDDASTDGSAELIARLVLSHPRVRGIQLERHGGQTAAMAAGFRHARGELIAILDADLQTDPREIPALIEDLGDAAAVVGYRRERNDSFVRRASSRIANRIRNAISGDSVRDTGCPLKVFRAEPIRALPLFDGMHRFLPTLLRMHGHTVLERGVSHAPRTAGKSKYGIRNRALRAFVDLLAVRWMKTRLLVTDDHEIEARSVELPRSAEHAAHRLAR